jgi:hypothetical protein
MPKPIGNRFQIGDYYLDRPYPDRGGIFYACRYDGGTRTTRRRSLGTADEAEAKIKLAAIVAEAPATTQGPLPPSEVLTVAILKAYIDERGSAIASEHIASRAVELFTGYMESLRQIGASVAFWTPSRQIECAKWLRKTYEHSPGYIARLFNVMRSAFLDAAKVKLRTDPFGLETETALMSSAPDITATQDEIAKQLGIPARGPRRPTLSLDDMAAVLDAIERPYLFRYAILALCTWARPEAITDFDSRRQVDWNAATIDLEPPGRRPTNKRRPVQPLSRCLADWLVTWIDEDAKKRGARSEAFPAARSKLPGWSPRLRE